MEPRDEGRQEPRVDPGSRNQSVPRVTSRVLDKTWLPAAGRPEYVDSAGISASQREEALRNMEEGWAADWYGRIQSIYSSQGSKHDDPDGSYVVTYEVMSYARVTCLEAESEPLLEISLALE
jgi:hypothetical protein